MGRTSLHALVVALNVSHAWRQEAFNRLDEPSVQTRYSQVLCTFNEGGASILPSEYSRDAILIKTTYYLVRSRGAPDDPTDAPGNTTDDGPHKHSYDAWNRIKISRTFSGDRTIQDRS